MRLRRLLASTAETRRFTRHARSGQDLEPALRDGRRLLLRGGHRDYHIFNRIFLRDSYRVAALPGPLGCVLDVGANTGLFACYVAPWSQRVICYEPSPGNFDVLLHNIQDYDHVSAHRAALASVEGSAYLHGARSGEFSLYPNPAMGETGPAVPVQTVTLDGVFEEHGISRCNLLKLDIEGAEYATLYAASGTTLSRIDAIHGEYHRLDHPQPEANIAGLRAFLAGHGFRTRAVASKRKPGQGRFFARRLRL